MPILVAVLARSIWRWLSSGVHEFYPPLWCKLTLLASPIIVPIWSAVLFAGPLTLALDIASGDHPPMQFQHSGERLVASGPINLGSTAAFNDALDRWPQVREVVLDSPGGIISEARQLARVIQARRLDTRIDSECLSACVDLFAAGQTRTMRADALIGLHSAWSNNTSPEMQQRISTINKDFEQRLFELGVERRFLEVGTSTPGHEMFINTARQAHIAGLATRVVER